MRELFARALSDVVTRGVDAIAVTGDLLDVPDYLLTHDDYYDYDRATWEQEVAADYGWLRDLLEATGLPYLALPGNHDWLAVMARFFAANQVVELAGHRLVTFWDRDFYAHVPRRFDRERTLMEQALGQDGPPQIHLQHYVITPELNQGWPHTYLEGEHLRRALADSGKVVLSVSGHYHPGTEAIFDGPCTFTCGPAFAEFPHRYRIYDLHDGAVASECYELLDRPLEAGRPVVFLDRDGVLNEQPSWRTGPEPLRLVPGVGAALRRLQEAGYALVVISSQSAVGAGYVTSDVVDGVFDRLARELWRDGVCWDAFYYSTGAGSAAVHPSFTDTSTAKPSPHFLEAAFAQFQLDRSRAWMIGDNLGDLQAGRAAGARPVLVRTGHGRQVESTLSSHAELRDVQVHDSIVQAAEAIVQAT